MKLITSKKLLKFKNINHGFFNKNGGVSKGIYKSLNCGPGSKDKKKSVNKNLEIVRRKIGKKAQKIFLVNQIQEFEKFVSEYNYDLRKIKIITSLIWINMAPLHSFPLSNFLFNLGKYNLFLSL